MHSGCIPQSFAEHHGANHGGHAGSVAHALHAGLFVGCAVRTVIIYIIGVLLAVAAYTADATAYGGLALVVLAEVLRIWQHCLEELQRDNLHFYRFTAVAFCQRCLIDYFVNTAHAYVLYHF